MKKITIKFNTDKVNTIKVYDFNLYRYADNDNISFRIKNRKLTTELLPFTKHICGGVKNQMYVEIPLKEITSIYLGKAI